MSEQSAEFNDERMNTRYGVLLEQYRSAGPSPLLERLWAQAFPGYRLDEYNTLFAAIAVTSGRTLVTRNLADFATVIDLTVMSWHDS